MRIVFIGYNYLPQYTSAKEWIERIRPSVLVMEALAKDHTVSYIGQIGMVGNLTLQGIDYYFVEKQGSSRFPVKVNKLAGRLKPDIVLIPGFHFPLQVLQLRWYLPSTARIILEHHADKPLSGIKRLLQKLADKKVDSYHFTSYGNAEQWFDANIIQDKNKCFEILSNSSQFNHSSKSESKQATGMNGNLNFLWVGRLDGNKDPITVLKGFERFLEANNNACLYMIYQEGKLLEQVQTFIKSSRLLESKVFLHGKIAHQELGSWYRAADYFLSGSHREGGSIALTEAMGCGCIPIVTAIPPSLKVTGNAEFGLCYEAGNPGELFHRLAATNHIDKEILSRKVEDHFKRHLSPSAIADRFLHHCEALIAK